MFSQTHKRVCLFRFICTYKNYYHILRTHVYEYTSFKHFEFSRSRACIQNQTLLMINCAIFLYLLRSCWLYRSLSMDYNSNGVCLISIRELMDSGKRLQFRFFSIYLKYSLTVTVYCQEMCFFFIIR